MSGNGIDRLRPLLGQWTGSGSGRYPTIESFDYDETTSFRADDGYPLIRYEQRTIISPSGAPSHWETGFVRIFGDGSVEINTAHQSGRIEAMRGRIVPEDDDLRVEFRSVALANDDRLVASERSWTVRGDTLQYEVRMATRTTPEPTMLRHLTALLQRVR